MYLRHIQPGSLDWNDAMEAMDGDRDFARLSPEEMKRLRLLSAAEQMERMVSATWPLAAHLGSSPWR